MDYKAVLFDFDYTLGDGTEAIIAGFNAGFAQMGHPQPDREAVRRTVGHTLEDEYAMLTGDTDPARQALFRKLYTEVAGPLQVKTAILFPGAAELLEALHSNGIPAAVVSSKKADTLNRILEARGVLPLLSSVTGGDMVSVPKPDPQGLLSAVKAMGLTPEAVLYCGDTVIDAECAQRAGADFCAVLNGTTPAEAFAAFPSVHIAPDLPELKVWLGL